MAPPAAATGSRCACGLQRGDTATPTKPVPEDREREPVDRARRRIVDDVKDDRTRKMIVGEDARKADEILAVLPRPHRVELALAEFPSVRLPPRDDVAAQVNLDAIRRRLPAGRDHRIPRPAPDRAEQVDVLRRLRAVAHAGCPHAVDRRVARPPGRERWDAESEHIRPHHPRRLRCMRPGTEQHVAPRHRRDLRPKCSPWAANRTIEPPRASRKRAFRSSRRGPAAAACGMPYGWHPCVDAFRARRKGWKHRQRFISATQGRRTRS